MAGPHKRQAIALNMMAEGSQKQEVLDHVEEKTAMLDDNDDDDDFEVGGCCRWVAKIETAASSLFKRNRTLINYCVKTILLLIYLTYFGYAMYLTFGDAGSYTLIALTSITGLFLFKRMLAHSDFSCPLSCVRPASLVSKSSMRIRFFIRHGLRLVTAVGIAAYLGITILKDHPRNLMSLVGIAVFITLCFIFSERPSRVNWVPVFWGFVLQFLFAALTLRTQVGYDSFMWLGNLIQRLTDFSNSGSAYVLDSNFEQMGLAFSLGGIMIFFNSLIFLLNYWGVIEYIVINVGSVLSFCLGTGPVESIIAVANIFLGMYEAPLLVRPYLPTVTKSELHAIMTCGFASVAGSIMGAFIRYGAPANHLLTASVISAPAALAISKLVYPETGKVNFSIQRNVTMRDNDKNKSALLACCEGAMMGSTLLVSVMVNMLTFVSFLSMLDAILGWLGERVGHEGLTFDQICAYLLFPLSYLMGADLEDCGTLGTLIGVKFVATPVVAYSQLGQMIKNRLVFEEYLITNNGSYHWSGRDIVLEASNSTLQFGVMSERSEVIATYALCGFSAFAAIGICIGSLIPMGPSRKHDIVALAVSSFVAGNVASFMTGAVAGVMYTG